MSLLYLTGAIWTCILSLLNVRDCWRFQRGASKRQSAHNFRNLLLQPLPEHDGSLSTSRFCSGVQVPILWGQTNRLQGEKRRGMHALQQRHENT